MIIKVNQLSKRFNYQYVFKQIDFEFNIGNAYAVLGPNGSGKSTFIKHLIAYITPSEGSINWHLDQKSIHLDALHHHFSIAAPYIDLIEDLTLMEMLHFHFKFKQSTCSIAEIVQELKLEKHSNKPLKLFSSGMKQRVKLALNFFSDVPVLIFDEPCTNLDQDGIDWYLIQINKIKDRLLIVASNDEREISFCNEHLNLSSYK